MNEQNDIKLETIDTESLRQSYRLLNSKNARLAEPSSSQF